MVQKISYIKNWNVWETIIQSMNNFFAHKLHPRACICYVTCFKEVCNPMQSSLIGMGFIRAPYSYKSLQFPKYQLMSDFFNSHVILHVNFQNVHVK